MDGNNVPIGAIQRILGHENRRTTEIYLHSIGDQERDAMAVFEQALGVVTNRKNKPEYFRGEVRGNARQRT